MKNDVLMIPFDFHPCGCAAECSVAREAKAPLMAEYPDDAEEVEDARPAEMLSVTQS
jgi:hypothetical protein